MIRAPGVCRWVCGLVDGGGGGGGGGSSAACNSHEWDFHSRSACGRQRQVPFTLIARFVSAAATLTVVKLILSRAMIAGHACS